MPLSKETLALIDTFKNPILNLLSDIKDEIKFSFEDNIGEYVDSIRNKFIRTKTFLYRLENVDFYDIYFPITLNFKTNKDMEVVNIEDLFARSNFISIIGNAGCGKSMLMKHIFLQSIEQIINIPIVIELRNLNEFDGSFSEYIINQLLGKKLTPNKKILDRILSKGDFLFLFDGYDEIYSDNKNKITTDLIDFIDLYSNNRFIISSRPGANLESLPRFDCYSVNSLSKKQIIDFINLQLKQCDNIKLADKIISVVAKPEYKDYNSYLSSPLLLSMFIMTFNSYPELPRSKSKFYWNVFDTLCTKHDTFTKHGGYQHERKTNLQNEDFDNILKWFSYTSLFKGIYSFDEQYFSTLLTKIKKELNLKCKINHLIEDLTVAISIVMIDGLEYKFPHKSLQEYFTALLIKEQSNDIKKSIYNDKFTEFSGYVPGGTDNFWNLCSELDPVGFNKYFILYNLENLINEINFKSDETICKSFLDYFDFKHRGVLDKKKNICSIGSCQWTSSIESEILEYLHIQSLSHLSLRFASPNVSNDISNKIINGTITKRVIVRKRHGIIFTIDYTNDWNDELFALIIESGVMKKIKKTIELIKTKIELIKKDIESDEKIRNKLLEL